METQNQGSGVRAIIKNRLSNSNTQLSNSAIELLERMLVIDPQRRATIEQVLEHRWVTGVEAPVHRGLSYRDLDTPPVLRGGLDSTPPALKLTRQNAFASFLVDGES